MKLRLLIYISLIGIFFISCSKSSERTSLIEDLEDKEYSEFLLSLDSLNYRYGVYDDSSRGFFQWGSEQMVCAVADAAGKRVGSWLGSQLGASLGVVTGNPVVGAVGYLGGRKYGGIAGCVAASYAASVAFEKIAMTSESVAQYCDVKIDTSMSVGMVHNVILSNLIKLDKSYVLDDGSLSFSELYNDIVMIEQKLLIEDELSLDAEFKSRMLSFCELSFSSARCAVLSNESEEEYVNRISGNLRELKFPEKEICSFLEIRDKLSAGTKQLDDDVTVSYEKDFEKIVDNSSIREKKATKDVGSVVINSAKFWRE